MGRQGVEKSVLVEQVRLLYDRAPTALVAIPLSGALVYVLWGVVAVERLFAFVVALLLVTARFLLWSQYNQRKREGDDARWATLYAWGAGVNGSIWGFGGAWLYPPGHLSHQVLVAFVIAGMVSGATVSTHSYFPALLAYVLTAVVPIGLRFAVEADPMHIAVALMSAVFCAVMVGVGRKGAARFVEGVTAYLLLVLRQRVLRLER